MYGTYPDIWDEMDSLMSRIMERHFGMAEPGPSDLQAFSREDPDPRMPSGKPLAEPAAEVHRNPESLSVVTELPGADPDGITLDLGPDTLVIEAESETARYRATADITGAPTGPMTSSFRNGVLEVTFRDAAVA